MTTKAETIRGNQKGRCRVTGARLVGTSNHVKGTLMHLTDTVYHIGHQADEDLVLSDSAVAERQCVLHRRPEGTYAIADLGSRTPTRVNGRIVAEAVLRNGDTLTLGNTEFTFLTDDMLGVGQVGVLHMLATDGPADHIRRALGPAGLEDFRGLDDQGERLLHYILLGLGSLILFAIFLVIWYFWG